MTFSLVPACWDAERVFVMRGNDDEDIPERLNPTELLARLIGKRGASTAALAGLKLLGVEIPPSVQIGQRLRLPHGAVGLVIHGSTVIGNDVKIFQGVTIGLADQYMNSVTRLRQVGGVVIEDDVIIGAGAKILFRSNERLTLGRECVVGANAVVLESVPKGEIWAGIPARRVGQRS